MSTPDPLAEATLRERTEKAHIVAQVVIVIAAMVLVSFALWAAFYYLGHTPTIKASDVVAVVGAVTTFLGTAIGLFFGISAGQTGKKASDQAAQTAAGAARTANDVAGESLKMVRIAQKNAEDATSRSELLRARADSFARGAPAGVRSFAAMADARPAKAQVVDVGFELDTEKTTARFARVFLKGSDEDDDIASSAKPRGIVPRQLVGSDFDVVLEVQGEPDDVGVFKVTHAFRPSIELKMSDGPVSVQTIIVTA